MIRRPPRSKRTDTPFPVPTLFRSPNPSPPTRASVSRTRSAPLIRRATVISNSSPASAPRHALTRLNRSRSTTSTAHDATLPASIIDSSRSEKPALAEQILAEATLLALEHVRQRFQRTLVGARDRATAAAVVEQRIDGFLQHALFVADDDVRRAQLHQPLQAVVAVDDAAVEVVQVQGREATAIERHPRAQLGRDHGEDRKSVVEGKSASVRVDLGVRRSIKKTTTNKRSGKHK